MLRRFYLTATKTQLAEVWFSRWNVLKAHCFLITSKDLLVQRTSTIDYSLVPKPKSLVWGKWTPSLLHPAYGLRKTVEDGEEFDFGEKNLLKETFMETMAWFRDWLQ